MGRLNRKRILARLALDRPEGRAWAMYDWANSAFMTTIIAAVFPVYFKTVAAARLDPDVAEARFQLATTLALVLIAVMAPILGALADFRAIKKRLLLGFVLLGVVSTALMFFIEEGDWGLALTLFAAGNVGAAGSIVFYDSLLPHIVPAADMDRLSTSGFALGYIGGGLLLAANLAWILKPELFGLPGGPDASPSQKTLPTRLAFLSVAGWWLVFTIPLWRRVKEPPLRLGSGEAVGQSALGSSFRRVAETWRELKRFRYAMLMLLAFLLFNDGVVTIIRMAAIYATGKGFATGDIIATILMVQFVGIPFAFLFGQLAPRFGAKRLVLWGLGIYCGISLLAFFMTNRIHFFALGFLVATVQGGTQGLSRSLFASLIPKYKSSEFFALFAVGEKFAGILGPLVFYLVTTITGSAQNAILSVIPFFLVGGYLLSRVDVVAGRRIAAEADAAAKEV